MAPDNILSKIQKLLALAESDNPHESASAAALAQTLMLRHHVDEAQLKAKGEATAPTEPIGTEKLATYGKNGRAGKVHYWQLRLAGALSRAFCCSHFYNPGYSITVVGRPSDRAVVVYLFNFLRAEVSRLAKAGWQRAQEEGTGELPQPADWQRAFCVGAVDTIAARLVDPAKGLPAPSEPPAPGEVAQTQQSTALVLRERAAKVRVWVEENLNLSRGGGYSHGGNSRRTSGYGEGKAAGHTVNLQGRGPRGALGDGT